MSSTWICVPPTARIRQCHDFSQLPFPNKNCPTPTSSTRELQPFLLLAHADNRGACANTETGGGTPTRLVHLITLSPYDPSLQAHFAAFPTPHRPYHHLRLLLIINNLPRPQPRCHVDPFLLSPSWRQLNPFEMLFAPNTSKSWSPRDHHCISSPPPRVMLPTRIQHLPHLSVQRTPSLRICLPGKRWFHIFWNQNHDSSCKKIPTQLPFVRYHSSFIIFSSLLGHFVTPPKSHPINVAPLRRCQRTGTQGTFDVYGTSVKLSARLFHF